MTQRSVLTTQSKLTVQAPGFGERGETRVSVSAKATSLSHGRQRTSCALPRVWGRSLERKFAILLT
ncbi:conserved hypothetical protein [Candidatus Desulfosporosinus infrequens]|uniref:Uncharacterized protein n=1 Tax=Candidatus Desulfosporosinus infrequens TaxID=2043169 RepID=A0A2U3K4V1_9FIRM|nr:conserved hypothetical protein [Candidatus Desulfosporosinus infrequens]